MEKRSRWQKKQRKPSSLHSNPLKQITKELSKTIVCGFLVAVISNFLLQVFQNQFNVEVAWLFMTEWHTELFLLGTGVLMMLYIWFTSLIGNRYVGSFLMLLISIVLGITTQQKMVLREEPMYPSDFSMITNLPFLLKMMNNKMFLLLILIFFIVFIGVYWFVRRTNKVKQKRLHQNLKEVKGLRIGLFALSSLSLNYIY